MCVRERESVCAQSCPTICDRMDCSPPGSSVHRISQARILEWVAIPSSRGSSRPRDQTYCRLHCQWILYYSATREAKKNVCTYLSIYTHILTLLNSMCVCVCVCTQTYIHNTCSFPFIDS